MSHEFCQNGLLERGVRFNLQWNLQPDDNNNRPKKDQSTLGRPVPNGLRSVGNGREMVTRLGAQDILVDLLS
jgi:hypothetical protein